MITIYTVKYCEATNTRGARLVVTRINDAKRKTVAWNFGVNSATRYAIHEGFGEDVSNVEYVANQSANVGVFAVQH